MVAPLTSEQQRGLFYLNHELDGVMGSPFTQMLGFPLQVVLARCTSGVSQRVN